MLLVLHHQLGTGLSVLSGGLLRRGGLGLHGVLKGLEGRVLFGVVRGLLHQGQVEVAVRVLRQTGVAVVHLGVKGILKWSMLLGRSLLFGFLCLLPVVALSLIFPL